MTKNSQFSFNARRGSSKVVVPIVLAVAVVAVIVGLLIFRGGGSGDGGPQYGFEKDSDKLQVGFVTVGPVSDWGWNYQHNQGRIGLAANLPDKVHTVIVEGVPETAEVERVMQRMSDQGADMIFSTSFGYRDSVLKVAEKNPDVIFMQSFGEKTSDNVGAYGVKSWEGAYACGYVTAMTLKDEDKFGFIGAHPIPPVIWMANSFALGAQKANPSVNVQVVFTNSWSDPAAESEAARSLIESGVVAIYAQSDSPIPWVTTAEREGAYVIGNLSDLSRFAPTRWITGSVWNWGNLYTDVVQAKLDGNWSNEFVTGGFKEGYVGLAPFGPAVEGETQSAARELVSNIASGEEVLFRGPIYDSAGKERVKEGETMTVNQVLAWDWYVRGVKAAGQASQTD